MEATIIELRHDKTNKMSVHPAKTQISLGIRPVWSESSLCAQWVAMDPRFLHADSEDSDQTGRMPRLIWVFAGRTVTLLVLSCRGSIVLLRNNDSSLLLLSVVFFFFKIKFGTDSYISVLNHIMASWRKMLDLFVCFVVFCPSHVEMVNLLNHTVPGQAYT